jgi:putative oxidoreductase
MDNVNFALLVLRVALGITFLLHGANKVRSRASFEGTGKFFESLGMRPGRINAALAAGTEIIGGALMALGLLTPLAAAMIIGLMLVAGVTDHRGKGFFIFRPGQGWEYVMMLGFTAFAIGTIGAGDWSLDHAIGIDVEDWWGAIIAGVLGVGGAALHLAVFYRPPKPVPVAAA